MTRRRSGRRGLPARLQRMAAGPYLAVLLCTLTALHASSQALVAQPMPGSQAAMPVVGGPLPPGLARVGVDEHLGAPLPLSLPLRDHTGAPVQLGRYFHKGVPVLIDLMYHRCPMLCSVVLDALTSSLRQLEWSVGQHFEVVTVSIDPHDTPDIVTRKRQQILARYARPSAERGWHFLTGDTAAIARLADALGFRYRWDPEQRQYAHPAVVFLATPTGTIARYLYGVDLPPRDLRFGLLEAAQGRSVTTLERVLLFCYHYDATGRRYSFVVTRVLRVGGTLVLLLLAALLAQLWRRESQRSRTR